MTKHLALRIFISLALLFTLAIPSWAQVLAGGSIQGTVSDSAGAVVFGAAVSARNLATNLTYKTTSDDSGRFVFPIVKVGTYEVNVQKSGFSLVKVSNVAVLVGSTVNIPVAFHVAGSKEEVNVSSEAALVETERTSVATNVNQRSIENLPVLGRNFESFVLLTPGVVTDPNRGGDLSFAGMRGTANSLTVDGNDDNNSFYGQAAARTGFKTPFQFSQDAVQEFQVASNGYSAELGRASGAVINAVTKSGTNQFHGDLFEFYRDQSLNAYDPITKQNYILSHSGSTVDPQAKPKYHYNQFGGSVGGPIVKDRLFFFFNLDDQRNTLPNILNPLPAISNPTAEQTTALAYLTARDANWDKTNNQNTYLVKLDGNINSKNQISARWNRQRFTAGEQESTGGTVSLEHTGNSDVHTDNGNVSLTSTLTPHIVNQLRVAYLRDREPGAANSSLPEAVVKNAGTTILQVGGNYFSPRETTIRQQQYSDSLNWMLGRHSIKLGADAAVAKVYNFFPGDYAGSYTFGSVEDFGCSLESLAPGTAINGMTCGSPTFVQAFSTPKTSGPISHPDTLEPSIFVQDDMHLLKNLSLNIGFRYDDQSVKQPGVQNPNALALGYNTAVAKIKNNEAAPRIGFAYDVLGNSRLVVRGGYGIFYGTTNNMLLSTTMISNGINFPVYTFTGAGNVPYYPNKLSGLGAGTTAAPSIWVMASNFQNPVVQQMNLGVEYAVTKDLSISLSGLRVKGDHLTRTADQNLVTPTAKTILDNSGVAHPYYYYPGRISSNFGRISLFESNASSQYNGLVFEMKKRFTHHLQGSLNYTWSHAIDNNPDATSVTIGGTDDPKDPMYPTMPWLDRGNAGADVRHRLNLAYAADLNYGRHKGWTGYLIDGWSTSGILIAQSGLPYSALIGSNLLGTGNTYNVRDSLVGRNSLRMPANWEFDPRITRDIKLPVEGLKFSLFAEAFNLFNHFNVLGVKTTKYSDPSGTLVLQNPAASATSYFGLPSSDNNARVIQLGAKFVF